MEDKIITEEKPEQAKINFIFSRNGKIILSLGILFALSFTYSVIRNSSDAEENDLSLEKSHQVVIKDHFNPLILEAKSVLVIDLNTREVFFSKNENEVLPLASLTKLMTAVVASEKLPKDSAVVINSYAIKTEGDSGFFIGERFRLGDIISTLLVSSSNDAASALSLTVGSVEAGFGSNGDSLLSSEDAEKNFVELMNQKARDLSMDKTHFFNPTGLDISKEEAGAFGSAKDVAIILSYIYRNHPEILWNTNKEKVPLFSIDGFPHYFRNTNDDLNLLPGISASKTGFTDIAGGNLAVIFEAGFNKPIVVIVLGATESGRFKDVEKLIWASLEKITNNENVYNDTSGQE